MSHRIEWLSGLACLFALVGACSATGGSNSFTGGGDTGAGAGSGQGPSGAGPGAGGDLGSDFVGSSSSTGAGTSASDCHNDPAADGDGDGWTGADGDCNDCDPNTNPGAIEVMTASGGDAGAPIPADEDCDGHVDNLPTACDDGLALGDVDAMHAAKALELCQVTEASPDVPKNKRWGVLDAKYVRADGSVLAPGRQVGIQTKFGTNVNPQGGARMLAISSGYARTVGQPDACNDKSCDSHHNGHPPAGFPQDNPSCPPSDQVEDDVGLELKVRAPTNATGYAFNFKFYSFEYPEWVCNEYNDQFVALVTPPPMGSINGNISFDKNSNAVSVNLAFFDVCDPSAINKFASNCSGGGCPSPPSPYCPSGTADLVGTGFDVWQDAGATTWLSSQAPVTGGSEISIRFAIWDTGDDSWDSTALIDNFRWIATGGNVTVSTDPVGTPK